MDSNEFQQYSQKNVNDSEHIVLADSPNSQYPLHSSQFQPNVPMPHTNPFAHSEFQNQFSPVNLQYQRTLPFNPMSAQFHAQVQQQFGSGFSQGLMNGPNLPSGNLTSKSGKGSKRNGKKAEISQTTQSPTLRRWMTEEDIALTKARLYVSGDADVGTDKKSATLWSRILNVWRENMGEYDVTRTSSALECRWGTIQSAVNKFHGFYEKLERTPQSGSTPEDARSDAVVQGYDRRS